MATRRTTKKDMDAKKRAEELLKDIPSFTKKKEEITDALEKNVKNKGSEWLEEQLHVLNAENDKLMKELETFKQENKKLYSEVEKLKNSPDAPVDVKEIKDGVKKIFTDLENNFLGRNSNRTRYEDAKIKNLLEKFLKTFPFLMKKK